MSQFDMNWIWTPDWESKDDLFPQFLCFRKELKIEGQPESCSIKIFADSRYKLYVNGNFLQEGPSKGDLETCYYDEAELLPYLKQGCNIIAVLVLRYPEELSRRNHSILRSSTPCLYVEGEYKGNHTEQPISLSGTSGWKCRRMANITLVAENARPAPLHILEQGQGDADLYGWMDTGYDDASWLDAKPYTIFQLNRTISPGNMKQRNIPYQRHIKSNFKNVVCVRNSTRAGSISEKEWSELLTANGSVVIPPNSKEVVEISAGELMTGYLKLSCAKGKNADIIINCAESYAYPPQETGLTKLPIKIDRTDFENGRIYGYEDKYKVGGFGTSEKPEIYEPFWFRTFRYIEITIETFEEPFILQQFAYTETGYPLDVKTSVKTSAPELEEIWDISERTLKRCMHETYMDCPFYEQLQYAMDSRSEILYTYAVSADDRLARKCMEDFRRSQRKDGMICCNAPSARSNVIPGFSIYYIMMVYDHMMYFGNKNLVKEHLPAIDSILNFFDRNLSERGLVENVGGAYMRHPYWSFIDWAPEWDATTGVPSAILKGPITMESLLYIMGLKYAAKLAEFLGRGCLAKEYTDRAEKVRMAVRNTCIGNSGLIQDGPGVDEYSVHCQVFGVLTDTVSAEDGRNLLEITVGNSNYAQCSVAMSFYLFRAMEKVGLYEKTYQLWDPWRKMLKNHLTTCVENATDGRSDCHAWGSTILYELPATVLGVKPAAPGFEEVVIEPEYGFLNYASGNVATPKGMIHVEWKKESNGEYSLSYQIPESITLLSQKNQ